MVAQTLKEKKDIIILFGLIFLLVVYFVLHKILKERRNPNKPIVQLKYSKIEKLELFNGKEKIVMQKGDDCFVFISPFAGIKAEKEHIERFIDEINKLTIQSNLGQIDKNQIVDFGILPVSPSLKIIFSDHDITMLLGMRNPVAQQNYVYLIEHENLYLTHQNIEQLLTLKPEFFRNRKLFENKIEDLSSAEIIKKGEKKEFLKEDSEWYLKDKNKQYLCDKNRINILMTILSNLDVIDFQPKDEAFSLSKCGLVSPFTKLNLEFSSGIIKNVGFGDKYDKNKVYVSLDNNIMGGINSKLLENLQQPVTNYIRYDIIDFPLPYVLKFISKDEKITYEYVKKRGKWYKTGRHTRGIKDEIIYEFFMAISNLKIEKFYSDEKLGYIEKEYVFYTRAGDVLSHLLIGEKKDGFVKIKFKDKRGVFGVPENAFNALRL